MIKSNAVVKVDTEENWNKAINYIPDKFTIIVYEYQDRSPKIKMGDGKHKICELPFLNESRVEDSILKL